MQRSSDEPRTSRPMVEGARWYRHRLRTLGPWVGLVPMVALGTIAMVMLRLVGGRIGGLVGLVLGCTAAPGLLIAGAPFAKQTHFVIAIGASAIGWIALGWWASRRATRQLIATWDDYWREMTWMIVAVLLGVVAAFLIASAVLGDPLIS